MMDHDPSNHRHHSSHRSSSKSHHRSSNTHKKSSSSDTNNRRGKLKTEGLEQQEWAPQQLNLNGRKNTFNAQGRDRYGSHNDDYDDDDDDSSYDDDNNGYLPQDRRMDLRNNFANMRCNNNGANDNNMIVSFRNLEEAMERAKAESLKSAGLGPRSKTEGAEADLAQSFRNLELALAEAQKNSLKDNLSRKGHRHSYIKNSHNQTSKSSTKGKSKGKGKGGGKTKSSLFESFANLDEATAQAISNSLSDKGAKSLFESFCNLDGAIELAKQQSIGENEFENQDLGFNPRGLKKSNDNYMVESFSDLDAAMALAMKNSLSDAHEQGGVDSDEDHLAQILERLDEEEAEGFDCSGRTGSEFSGSMRSGGGGAYDARGSFGGSNNSSQGGGYVNDDGADADNQTVTTTRTINQTTNSMLHSKERHRSSVTDSSDGNEGEDPKNKPGVECVAEPAPNLSRLARRHANRRFNDHQQMAMSSSLTRLTSGDNNDERARSGRRARASLFREDGGRAVRRHSSLSAVDMQEAAAESESAVATTSNSRRPHRRMKSNGHSSSDLIIPEAEVRDARKSLHYAGRQDSLHSGAMAFEQTLREKKSKKKMLSLMKKK